MRYKLTAVNGQVFVSNHNKKEVEHDFGVKRYDDIVEIVFSKNLMQSVKYIDFYYKDNSDAWLDLKGNLPDSWEHCGRVTIGTTSICYCLEQGIVEKNCESTGNLISEKLYEKASIELGIEKAVMLAIARQESHKSSFWKKNQATILYERHKMWKYLQEDLGELEAAVNICEVQQFKLFIGYLKNTHGMIKALKNKEWKTIAKLYNGSSWEIINPKYAENIKKYYEEYSKK